MPNYKGHLVGGFIVYCIIIGIGTLYATSFMVLLQWLLSTLAGSLFPDIDTKSKGQKLLYTLLFVMSLVLLVQKRYRLIAYCGVVAVLPLITRHRGIFHKLWFIILIIGLGTAGLISLYPCAMVPIGKLAGFFLAGAISHLYLDLGLKRMLRW